MNSDQQEKLRTMIRDYLEQHHMEQQEFERRVHMYPGKLSKVLSGSASYRWEIKEWVALGRLLDRDLAKDLDL